MLTIRVLPNPRHALDHNGEPQCAVPMINHETGALLLHRYVGATYDRSKMGITQHQDGTERAKRFAYTFDEKTPVTLPFEGQARAYYQRAVQDGALFAADAESAALCGVSFDVPKSDSVSAKKSA